MNRRQEREHHPLRLYYSYADEDVALCMELEQHLSLLQQQGIITGWHRGKTLPGDERSTISNESLSSADVILLLISPDFLASAVALTEMQEAIKRYDTDRTHVIPLLIRPCDWQYAPFTHLQVLPHNEKAVTVWENRDLAFESIAKAIRLKFMHTFDPAVPYVFLSYARKDFSLVNRLKEDLQAHGTKSWMDQTTLQPDSPDEEENLRVAIRNASALVLVVSTQTRRSRVIKDEISIAQMYQRPIYLFWMDGDLLAEVIPTSCKDVLTFDARAERYSQALQDLMQVFDRSLPSLSQDLPLNETITLSVNASRNPYKGLHPFRSADADDFFGRDRLIDELIEQVRQRLTTNRVDESEAAARLLTVLGPSGSGKSSLVMAGLVPRLQQGVLPDSQDWRYLDPIVPGRHPIEALILTLSSLFPERSLKSIREDLEDDEARGLHMLLAAYVKQSGKYVILIIDQCEELFIQTATEEEQRRFLDLLLAAITEPRGPLFVILTMRADFYDRLLLYPEFGRQVEKYHISIYPMDVQELRAIIEQPARLPDVQVTFEGDLVGDLLFDIRGQAGALPLLQFTLDQLFQRREERMFTLRVYHDIGGVKGALAQHAERIYQSLPSQTHQHLGQALFSRLIDPGTPEADATKRRIPLSAFTLIDPGKTQMLAEVIKRFTDERLLIINTVANVSTLEVSHEALVGAWNRLRDWLHEARDMLRLQQVISADATAWKQHEHSRDRLYRGTQLAEALLWRGTNIPNVDEDAFLQASVVEKRRTTRRRILISGGVAAGMIGSGFLVYMLRAVLPSSPLSVQPIPQPKSLPYAYRGHSAQVTGHQMENASLLLDMIRLCKSGMLEVARASSHILVTLTSCRQWPGHLMASALPPLAPTKLCRFGMPAMAPTSSPIPFLYSGLFGHRIASTLPLLGMTRPCKSGTSPMVPPSSPIRGMPTQFFVWLGHLMASISPLLDMTRPCKSGVPPLPPPFSPTLVIPPR
jgi:energy-coupling factor transporter ATP-binding protein EcfA2